MTKARRWPVVGLLVVAAGCGGTTGSTTRRSDPGTVPRPGIADRLSASQMEVLRQRYPGWDTDFAKHAVPLSQFQDGGPPRDGIPPIDDPVAGGLSAGDRFLS